MVGFFGKLYLFAAAMSTGLAWAVLVAILVSVVSAAYYLRIVRAMFFAESAESTPPALGSRVAAFTVLASAAITVALGLWAGPLLSALGAPLP